MQTGLCSQQVMDSTCSNAASSIMDSKACAMRMSAAASLSQVCRCDSRSANDGLPRKLLTTLWASERPISVILQNALMESFHQAALATLSSQGRQVKPCVRFSNAQKHHSELRQRLTFGILVQLGSAVGAEYFDCPIWELLGRLGHADNCQPAGGGSEVACVQCTLFASCRGHLRPADSHMHGWESFLEHTHL